MDNFKAIYKILSVLDRHKGDENFDDATISADTLKIAYTDWEQLLIELQRNGYIDGVVYTKTMSDKFPHIVEPVYPRITLKGMEYLSENSFMKKAAATLRGIKEIIPGM